MVVYFFDSGSLIKIGITRDLRIRRLAFGEGGFLGAMLGGREIERTLHDEFAAFRAHGEWFHRDPILLATIARLVRERGVAGDDCERLTDCSVSPSDFLERREQLLVAVAASICKAETGRIAKRAGFGTGQAIEALAALLGAPNSMIWGLHYRPPRSLPAAFAERLFDRDLMPATQIGSEEPERENALALIEKT